MFIDCFDYIFFVFFCKANERVALSTDTVAEAMNSRGIKVIEGDWTTEDPIITEWLEMYDRAGVPLYLYFPKGSSLETVTILPQTGCNWNRLRMAAPSGG